MTRVYVADAKPEERSALRLLLLDLKMEVVGEATDWSTTLANAPATRLDILLVDWELLPIDMQGFSDPFSLICADLLSLFHLAVPPNSFKQR